MVSSEAASGLDDAERVDALQALERLGCVVTAAQAHLARELDESQRAAQADAGVPAVAGREQAWRDRWRGRGGSRRTADGSTSDWRRSSPASCRTRGRPGGRAASPSGRPRSSRARPRASRWPTGWSWTRSSPGTPRPSRRWETASWRARAQGGRTTRRRRPGRPAPAGESERRVTLRPAPDTMTYLTALLPVKDGVAGFAALTRAADAAARPATNAVARPGDGRRAGARAYDRDSAATATPDRRRVSRRAWS